MRALLALTLVVGSTSPLDARREMPFDDYAVEPCGNGKTWAVVQKCLAKTGTIEIIHQTDKTKTITLTPKGATNDAGRRVLLYAQTDTGWMRTSLSLFPTKDNELLRVDTYKTPTGDGIRLEMGSTARTSFILAPSTTAVKGVLRRTFTTVCMPAGWTCRAFITSCEAYVRDKVYWSFHGEVIWHASLGLRLRGSRMAAGGLCKPADSVMLDPEEN